MLVGSASQKKSGQKYSVFEEFLFLFFVFAAET
jgi:hypothetical protein